MAAQTSSARRPFGSLYVQVLAAIAVGVALGYWFPGAGAAMKPLGEAFVRLIKMLIAPLIFCTIVAGIAGMGDMKKVGRVGLKALLYFEALTTLALLIGLAVVEVVRPGEGMHIDPSQLDARPVEAYAHAAQQQHGAVDFVLNIIPSNVVEAFARGDILQVLLFAVLFGAAASALGTAAAPLVGVIEQVGHVLFAVVGIIMRLAPVGAFGAMAFTVGKYGLGSLAGLGKLMGAFYLTSVLFVVLVLGAVCRALGLSIFGFLRYIREEIFLVLGTSSSESALPRMLEKMEALGCSRSVVGLVIPTGYSFNLDGTSIYLTMAAMFVAQATGTHLTLSQKLGILLVLLLTSKGAAAVTGGGFITLSATLASTGSIPVAGLTLLLGVDRFMSEARAITNLIGNGVATMVVARWEGELDVEKARRILSGKQPPPELPEQT
jgi:aerobic C4-dicarboxylate transport protein